MSYESCLTYVSVISPPQMLHQNADGSSNSPSAVNDSIQSWLDAGCGSRTQVLPQEGEPAVAFLRLSLEELKRGEVHHTFFSSITAVGDHDVTLTLAAVHDGGVSADS